MAISSNATGLRPGVCTSTTRPTNPYTGQIIFETDTGYLRVWDGSAWDYFSPKQDTVPGLYSSWTPSWTGTTNPAIGNGTVTGIYTQVNKLVVAQVSYYFGSTTTYGTGTYGFSAPVTAASHSAWANIGFGRAYDASTSTTYFVVAFWDAFSTSTIRLQSTTGGQLGQTAPVTWANGDEIHFSITYEAA